ncbi:M28 family peptidase [Mucilaginibacter sp. ZT4R22]|uniref:M28 family peptidase n=1 Tax=Mucilaginibacter pankratovii TaxID=2772110 RepID=A0ABR7WM92_9SPHI|nr:M28 family peptidase [Mucilaginibacter pankratovii]MBD1363419.1 M28 family peptidase [Mucilaginibacter pankratovii]
MRLLTLFLLCSTACMAQQKSIESITGSCSTVNLKKNLYYLASNKLQGRLMGSRGDTLTAKYIAEWYKQNGVQAPYDKGRSYFQSITAVQKVNKAALTINNKTYDYLDGWQMFVAEPTDLKNVPVLYVTHNSIEEFYRDLPQMEVREKTVFFNTKLIRAFIVKGIDSMEMVLKKRGALMVAWSGPFFNKIIDRQKARRFIPQYVQPYDGTPPSTMPLPEINVTPLRLREMLAADNLMVDEEANVLNAGDKRYFDIKSRLTVQAQIQFKETHAPNVIGVIKGSDTSLASVVISAHHDHDGVNGKEIYYGSVDNASGTVAIMEVAAMMNRAVKQGLTPKRTIVFASFTGEERGLLGSAWYVDHPLYSMKETYGVLNIDMFGRPDTIHVNHHMPDSANYVYVLVKDTVNRGLREALYTANDASTKLTLDTYYENPKYMMRRLTGSDQYSFYLKGVPFIRIDCGFCSDYHKPTDTPDKINYALLTKQTQLAFTTLWNMANK